MPAPLTQGEALALIILIVAALVMLGLEWLEVLCDWLESVYDWIDGHFR